MITQTTAVMYSYQWREIDAAIYIPIRRTIRDQVVNPIKLTLLRADKAKAV